MDYEVLGWPEAGPTLRLDHERFSYAGKFVMSATGKAVARSGGSVVAAAAFNEDHAEAGTLRIRYVTVRTDRRGEGVGSRLLRFVRERASRRGYERVRIAVNNPFAYEAASKAGFAFTGEETGLAELLLEWPGDRRARYAAGLDRYRERDLTPAERTFLDRRGPDPPRTVPDQVSSGADSNSRD